MLQQDQQVIGIDERLFGRAFEKVVGVMGQKLIERVGRGNQNGQRRLLLPPGPPGLLPRTGNRAGIADQHGRTQLADVDAKFEGAGGDDGFDVSAAQLLFDLAALTGQVAAAVGADGGIEN